MLVLCLPSCTDSCEDVVCLNGGACVDGDCACAEGWQGDDCSEPILQPPVPTGCEDLAHVTFDGHTYDLVQIGTQCWFKQNLRSDNYRNGDPIPGDLIDSQWGSTNSGAQAVYGDNNNANLSTYGRLYNWYAVDDERGLCPTGFHVPTDGEWTELVNYLGGEEVAGAKMKSSPSDTPAWDGTNSSGFSALPGGYRANYSGYFDSGYGGLWWSSSADGADLAWGRVLAYVDGSVLRGNSDQRYGFSVRCVRDE